MEEKTWSRLYIRNHLWCIITRHELVYELDISDDPTVIWHIIWCNGGQCGCLSSCNVLLIGPPYWGSQLNVCLNAGQGYCGFLQISVEWLGLMLLCVWNKKYSHLEYMASAWSAASLLHEYCFQRVSVLWLKWKWKGVCLQPDRYHLQPDRYHLTSQEAVFLNEYIIQERK